MRIAVLRQLSKPSTRPVAANLSVDSDGLGDPLAPRLVRCECSDCGTHSNAIVTTGTRAGCTNCGGARLVPVKGASVIVCAQRR
jgi:hypothetical protein